MTNNISPMEMLGLSDPVASDSSPSKKRFKMCYVDFDTILYRSATFLQDNFLEITHTPSGKVKRFKNLTSFGTRKNRNGEPQIIKVDPELDKRKDEDGNPVKWLGWLNYDREQQGKPPFSLEDFSIEAKAEMKKDFESLQDGIDQALISLSSNIKTIKEFMDADDYRLCISGGDGNYRDKECRTNIYKGDRGDKPLYYKEFREAFIEIYKNKILYSEYAEAEDILSYRCYEELAKKGANFDDWDICISYIDKDCDMIYGKSFNYNNLEDGWRIPSLWDCEVSLASQVIAGDPTDSILGLPSVGNQVKQTLGVRKGNGISKDTAYKILQGSEKARLPYKELWSRVVHCYQDYYGIDTTYEFVDIFGVKQCWTWLDYMQQCYSLVKLQDYKGQIPCIREYLNKIGVDVTEEVKYNVEVVDNSEVISNVKECINVVDEVLKDSLKGYAALKKDDLLERMDNTKEDMVTIKNKLQSCIKLDNVPD